MQIENKIILARKIFEISNIKGKFKLRSGFISNEYFDKYLFESDPKLLRKITEELVILIPPDTEILGGLELGGIPIATVLSQITGLPLVFIRKKSKSYGTCKLVEGKEITDRKILIVEDIITTGGQVIDSVNELRGLGCKISDVICVIDRESGGIENLSEIGINSHSLFTMTEIKQALI